jgi:hypothetical protein
VQHRNSSSFITAPVCETTQRHLANPLKLSSKTLSNIFPTLPAATPYAATHSPHDVARNIGGARGPRRMYLGRTVAFAAPPTSLFRAKTYSTSAPNKLAYGKLTWGLTWFPSACGHARHTKTSVFCNDSNAFQHHASGAFYQLRAEVTSLSQTRQQET